MSQKKLHPFSIRLTRFIDAVGATQAEVARRLDVSPQAFNTSYFRDAPFPGADFFRKLMILGCDLHWLLGGIGRPPDTDDTEEMKLWIAYCEQQIDLWKKRIELQEAAKKEIEVWSKKPLSELSKRGKK